MPRHAYAKQRGLLLLRRGPFAACDAPEGAATRDDTSADQRSRGCGGRTAISQLKSGELDWDAIFAEGVRWFHTGGVVAALSENSTVVVREAMEAARRHGTVVSFDCNYRSSLWKARGGRSPSIEVNRSLMSLVDVLFGHEGDISATLGDPSQGPVWHTLESFRPMAERIVNEFTNLKALESTVRQTFTANNNRWSAFGFADRGAYEGLNYDNLEILDRVSGGDSFASDLIYGLLAGNGLHWALDCGVAHGALAMTTVGDSSMASLAEVTSLMTRQGGETVR
jgi:2-dehydro-3-deoxygluconokinase